MKNELNFTFSSNNIKEHYSSLNSEKITIQGIDNSLNKLSMLNTDDYDILPNSQPKPTTISYFWIDQYKFFNEQIVYSPIGKQSRKRILSTFAPRNALFDINEVKLFKVVYEKKEKRLTYILSTTKRIFSAEMTNNKPEIVLDLSEYENFFIKGMFTSQNCNDNRIYVLISFNIVIEIDLGKEYNKSMFDNLFKTFTQKSLNSLTKESKEKDKNKSNTSLSNVNNLDPLYRTTVFEYYEKTVKTLEYTVLTFDKNSNFITGWKMPNDELILLMHIAYLDKNKFLCVVLNTGLIRLFNYSSYQIEAEYKTHYGTITSVSFSEDGALMGLGVEDDNVYIIDMILKKVLFCLEGHRNYVSDIIFSLQSAQEEAEAHSKTYLKQISYDTISKVKTFKDMHLFKNIASKDFLKCWEDDAKQDTDKFAQRNRADSIMNQNEICYQHFDIYTCGLDGYICSWKVEAISQLYQFDNNTEAKGDKDDKGNSKAKNKKKLQRQDKILLKPEESIKNSPIYIEKINKQPNLPIVKMIKVDTVIGTASRRNTHGSQLMLSFYLGTKEKAVPPVVNTTYKMRNIANQKDKVFNNNSNSNTNNSNVIIKNTIDSNSNNPNKDLKAKMEMLNKTSVKIKDVYSKTFNTRFNTTTVGSINQTSPTKVYNLTGNGRLNR